MKAAKEKYLKEVISAERGREVYEVQANKSVRLAGGATDQTIGAFKHHGIEMWESAVGVELEWKGETGLIPYGNIIFLKYK